MAQSFIQLSLHGRDEKLSIVFVRAALIRIPLPELQQDCMTEIIVGSQSHLMVALFGKMQVTQTPLEIARKLSNPDMILADKITIPQGNEKETNLDSLEIEFIRDLRKHDGSLQMCMKNGATIYGLRIVSSFDGQQIERPSTHLRLVRPNIDYHAS